MATTTKKERRAAADAAGLWRLVDPPVGDRRGFLTCSVQLPGEMVLALRREGIRRRELKQANRSVSGLVREAIARMLEGER